MDIKKLGVIGGAAFAARRAAGPASPGPEQALAPAKRRPAL